MPEGDTVWRTAQALGAALVGSTLIRSDFRVPELAEVNLTGERVTASESRGKHLLLHLGHQRILHTHLKMEGAWHLYRPENRWQRPASQARVVLQSPRWLAVGFSLGIVEMWPSGAEFQKLAYLGPDLLGANWDLEKATSRLRANPERPIAEALIDQRNLAGLGNLYRAELLFVSGINPTTPVDKIVHLDRLINRAKSMLESNKERAVQVTTGNLRPGYRHWVYDRAGQPCRRCKKPIVAEPMGEPGRERTIFWCPTCQSQFVAQSY
ncbi:DNA-formamidopyrimidine glycosylase family protein [Nocardioides sp. Bht2]|uniref:DNA-formamidopyrimidine glycosylase family protein n=1 Tax=Nocardioides sp. Bht2 TaxID=3392297 RepID=UPI0039B6695A